MWAAENGREAVVVRLLIERDGVDINATDNEGNKTALSLADGSVKNEDTPVVGRE